MVHEHFKIPSLVCVNKWDLNPEVTERIESNAIQAGARVVGLIGYDPGVMRMQMEARATTKGQTPAAHDIIDIWNQVVLSFQDARRADPSTATISETSHSSEIP